MMGLTGRSQQVRRAYPTVVCLRRLEIGSDGWKRGRDDCLQSVSIYASCLVECPGR